MDGVAGGQGNDLALLGDGDDLFRWNPGDGSDTVEGAGGADRLLFNGSNANESIDITVGNRVRTFRAVGNVAMDLAAVERIEFNAFGRAGDDVLLGGAGDDVLDGGPGDDVVLGKAGNDTLNGEISIQGFTSPGVFA